MNADKTQPLPTNWFKRLTLETPALRPLTDAASFRVTSQDLTVRIPVVR